MCTTIPGAVSRQNSLLQYSHFLPGSQRPKVSPQNTLPALSPPSQLTFQHRRSPRPLAGLPSWEDSAWKAQSPPLPLSAQLQAAGAPCCLRFATAHGGCKFAPLLGPIEHILLPAPLWVSSLQLSLESSSLVICSEINSSFFRPRAQ